MRVKILLTSVVAMALASSSAINAQDIKDDTYSRALDLYRSGMYERARTLFENSGDNELSSGYAALCALKLQSIDCARTYADYVSAYPYSTLVPELRYERALILFDDQDYRGALDEFNRLDAKSLTAYSSPECVFKRGYSAYVLGEYPLAAECFGTLEGMPFNDYTPTARYLSGYMDYSAGRFATAEDWFAKSIEDPRYEDLSRFYIVDCRFNRKDYDYVLEHGVPIFDSVPTERRDRLARMISESYLVKGDKENARLYYDESSHSHMTRSDYFYAGSVLYAVDDFQGAVDNFTKMTDRSDSLGQIANYQLGNAYIHTRNNVAAMDAFKAASDVSFDPHIREDALFNYAKLAFDLNKDPNGFTRYIADYSTRTKGDQIYIYMALAALYNRDYEGAVAAYDNIEELEPGMRSNYTKANYLRAVQLIGNGSWRDAVPCLRAAAYYLPKTDRLNQLSRYWLAEAYYRSDKFDQAADIYTDLYNASALEDRSEGSLIPYNLGYCFLKQGDFQQAARWFDSYAANGALLYREDALTRRADCDFASRNYKAAISSYQKVLSEFFTPNDIYPYYRQGLAYGLSGDDNKKLTVLSNVEKASSTAPLYDEAMYELARTMMDLKKNKDAIRVFSKLRSTTGDSTYVAKSLIGLGMAGRNSGDYDKALGYYKSVVDMMPGSEFAEDALAAIESIYQTKHQPEKYLEYVEQNKLRARATEQDREDMYFNTAEQVYLGGNSQQAVTSLLHYLEEYPHGTYESQAMFYLADSYRSLGNKEKAVDCYSKVIDLGQQGSSYESSLLGYANLSYSLERYDNAYIGYARLLASAKIDANKQTGRLGMMRSAFKARKYEEAVTAASVVLLQSGLSADLKREAEYIQAKSYLSTSRRAEALAMFKALAADPSTVEGAEAKYILVQDIFDQGDFVGVESAVYEFSQKYGQQTYWLAKAYMVLADSFAERDMKDQAKATLESIIDGYEPSGDADDVMDNARMRLQRLEEK